MLCNYIENDLLRLGRPRFLEHLFPEVTLDNYKENQAFLNKAEDMFVFHHLLNLTRILYVSSILPNEWQAFLAQNNGRLDKSLYLTSEPKNITADYLQKLWDFILQHPFEHHRHRYGIREHKIAAVMSCGKNFAVWKTAGSPPLADGTHLMRRTTSSMFD